MRLNVVADVAKQAKEKIGGVIGVGDEDDAFACARGVFGDALDDGESDAEVELDLLFGGDEGVGEAARDAAEVAEDLVDLEEVYFHTAEDVEDHAAGGVFGIDAQMGDGLVEAMGLEGGMLREVEEDINGVLDEADEGGVEDVEGDNVDCRQRFKERRVEAFRGGVLRSSFLALGFHKVAEAFEGEMGDGLCGGA